MKKESARTGTVLPAAGQVNEKNAHGEETAPKPSNVPSTLVKKADQVPADGATGSLRESRPPISTTLSNQASELVRWYCHLTHHRESSTVEGAVFGVLERAKDAYQEGAGGDEAFNWLLSDVLAGMRSVARQPDDPRWGGGFTVQLSVEASEQADAYREATGCDLRDIVSGAVVYLLKQAFENEAESIKHRNKEGIEAHSGRSYHDGAWGYVREAIDDAMDQRKRADHQCPSSDAT